jgi:hypothetical protein
LGAIGTTVLHGVFLVTLISSAAVSEHHQSKELAGSSSSTDEGSSTTMILLQLPSFQNSSEAMSLSAEAQAAADLMAQLLDSLEPPSLPDFEQPDTDQAAPVQAGFDPTQHARLLAGYMEQVSARITRGWIRPRGSIEEGAFNCVVNIEQNDEGAVRSVELIQCNGDTRWQLSLVQAIERATPLSAAPHPDVFARQVVSPNQWIWLTGAAAARNGAYVDAVQRGGPYLTGALRSGASGALRVVSVVGIGVDGVSIGYELGQRHWDSAAYKAFDMGASFAAVKYFKGWGALAALIYKGIGGSQAIAKNMTHIGLVQGCAAEMGLAL